VAAALILIGAVVGVVLMIRHHPIDQYDDELYDFNVVRDVIEMTDGTQLAVTYALPITSDKEAKYAFAIQFT